MRCSRAAIAIPILAVLLYVYVAVRKGKRLRSRREPTLIQCPVAELTPAVLVQRQPVLISEQIVHPDKDLPSTAFRWMHIQMASRRSVAPPATRCRARGRFALVWKTSEGRTTIEIADPSGKYSMQIIAAEGQVLVMPQGWRFACSTDQLEVFEMHDAISLLTRS